jgi:hypothetical protein
LFNQIYCFHTESFIRLIFLSGFQDSSIKSAFPLTAKATGGYFMADYLPKKETELDAWLLNFSTKMNDSGENHGFSGEEIKRIKDDYAVLHSLVQGSETIRVNQSEYVAYKNILFLGGANDPAPSFPTMTTPTAPTVVTTIESGIIERIRAMVRRLRASPNYNEAVG